MVALFLPEIFIFKRELKKQAIYKGRSLKSVMNKA